MSAVTAQDRAAQARSVAADPQRLAQKTEIPLERWVNRCHEVSLALVKTGEFGPDARVARGWAAGVSSQHSWIALGDPYGWDTVIVDPTHPAYHKDGNHEIAVATFENGKFYMPQGWGVLTEEERESLPYIMPRYAGPEKKLTGTLGAQAQLFLAEIGLMDFRRWCWLASMLPMGGWPSQEIISAMLDSGLEACVPIDIQGMITDRNPKGLYLASREETP